MPSFLRDIPKGADVFIDTNIFIFAFYDRSKDSIEFLRKCASGYHHAFISTVVLWEATHQFMIAEVADELKRAGAHYRNRKALLDSAWASLKKNKHKIPQMQQYWLNAATLIEDNPVSRSPMAAAILGEDWVHSLNHCVAEDSQEIHLAAHILRARKREGLLTADSLILAAALSLKIGHMASTDIAFDGLRELARHEPSDIPRNR